MTYNQEHYKMVSIRLKPEEFQIFRQLCKEQGISYTDVIREWIAKNKKE